MRKWYLKQTPHFNVPSNIDFNLFITLYTWYTTLGPFYPIWRQWRDKRNKYSKILKNWLKNWIWSLKNANSWKCRSFYCCLVAMYYFETVLKNLGKWRLQGPLFHTFHQTFYKNFVIFVFWSKYSPFAPILIMIDCNLDLM